MEVLVAVHRVPRVEQHAPQDDPTPRAQGATVVVVDQVPEALRTAPSWDPSAIDFATV